MRQQAVRYLVYSQLAFVVTVLICAALEPSVIRHSGALSTFGTLNSTYLAFGAGLTVVALLLVMAARSLPRGNHVDRTIGLMFSAMATLLVVLAFTPYNASQSFAIAHGLGALLLYIVQLAGGAWLIARAGRTRLDTALYCAVIVGQVMTVLSTSEVDVVRLMTISQCLVIFAFAVLLCRTVARIEHVSRI